MYYWLNISSMAAAILVAPWWSRMRTCYGSDVSRPIYIAGNADVIDGRLPGQPSSYIVHRCNSVKY